jgi:protein aurora borealis
MVDPVETADESTWIKEPLDNGNLPMSDFVSGIAFSIENSHMCMSPLAESSVLPCESSNVQVRCFNNFIVLYDGAVLHPFFL